MKLIESMSERKPRNIFSKKTNLLEITIIIIIFILILLMLKIVL
jgi:hypothetical protein